MGESNQAGPVDYTYYLWTRGEASSWYVARVGGVVVLPDFETYRFKEGNWCFEEGGYGSDIKSFFDRHCLINHDMAFQCIIGGPQYCLHLQRELCGQTSR